MRWAKGLQEATRHWQYKAKLNELFMPVLGAIMAVISNRYTVLERAGRY